MGRKTINQLTELTEANVNDKLAIYDASTNTTKKITKENLVDNAQVTEVRGGGDTGCSFIAHKKNGIVTVWIYIGETKTASLYNFGTLPEGFRPAMDLRVVGWTAYTLDFSLSYVLGSINTNGTLTFYIPNTTTTTFIASATFIAEK